MKYDGSNLKEVMQLQKLYADTDGKDGEIADFSHAILIRANLSYADLSHADLRYADLRHANLSYANLSDAEFSHADLRYANLSYADLRYADLRYANLSYANLSYANLIRADLSHADLSHANLSHAEFSHADLRHADLRDADLRGAELDFSVFPLWCGGLNFKIDELIAKQLMYHTLNLMIYSDIDIPDSKEDLIKFANGFHRVGEVDKLEVEEIKLKEVEK